MTTTLREPLRLFGLLSVTVFALGLPLVLNVTGTNAETMYWLAGLLAIAVLGGGAIAAFVMRPNRPFTERAPSPAAAPASPSIEYSLNTREWSLALLRRIEWRRFEQLCGSYFGILGFSARRIRVATEGGVDIDLYTHETDGRSMIVQCAAWSTNTVGIKLLRALREVMIAENVAEGVVLSSGQFTREARDFAGKENIGLVSGAELLQHIAGLPPEQGAALLKLATQGDFVTPTCPACDVKMEARTSADAGRKFWGCTNYPRCKHTFFSTHNAPA
jgi:hypothetical protein